MDPSGPACSCGRNGCLQSLIGPQSLLTVGDLLPADEAARLVDERPEEAIRKIVEAIDEGQAAMLQMLKRVGGSLGGCDRRRYWCRQSAHRRAGRLPGCLSAHLMTSIDERIARRLAIPAFAETKVVAVEQSAPRVVGGAVLAARDACFYDPLSLTRPV